MLGFFHFTGGLFSKLKYQCQQAFPNIYSEFFHCVVFSVCYTEKAMMEGAESVAERKRLRQVHACRRRSPHTMWAREEGSQNCKTRSKGKQGARKHCSLWSQWQHFSWPQWRHSWKKPCECLPVSLCNKQQSQSSYGVSTWAGVPKLRPAGIPGQRQWCCQGCLGLVTILSTNTHLLWVSLAKGIISILL